MKQALYGLLLYIFLILPPVASLLESIMMIHMHMQMPLLIIAGFFMARFFQIRFPRFFEKWNNNGIPGITLLVIIWSYWSIPRAMDEALTVQSVEWFKFISLPFLAGVPLRDSWKKLSSFGKNIVYLYFIVTLLLQAWVFIGSHGQICNNYLVADQQILGWSSLVMAACLIIYLLQLVFFDQSEYE
jgi:hypothetical protein